MTYSRSDRHPINHALPGPQQRPEFYEGVPGKRAVAWVLDMILIFGLTVIALPFTIFAGVFFFPLLMLVLGFFYRWAGLSIFSATTGMALMGIQIRGSDGDTLTGATAFWHTAGYSLSVMMMPLQIISVILMGVSARGRGLSDLALGTTAVNRIL